MDRVQKVRSVPHGQIYRPVFDAEEQLIKVTQSDWIINLANQKARLKIYILVDKIAQEPLASARICRRRLPQARFQFQKYRQKYCVPIT